MKRNIFLVITFIIVWSLFHKGLIWLIDCLPIHIVSDIFAVIITIIAFAIVLVITKKIADYFNMN